MTDFNIDTYKKLLKEIEQVSRVENLRQLEERIIRELVILINDGSEMAQYLLQKLEAAINLKLTYKQTNRILTTALRKSIAGAFNAAKDAMI
jgi:CTP:phosphocholine cytidylyltransferase-like protein